MSDLWDWRPGFLLKWTGVDIKIDPKRLNLAYIFCEWMKALSEDR